MLRSAINWQNRPAMSKRGCRSGAQQLVGGSLQGIGSSWPANAADELPAASAELTPYCFIVRDADGQALSYVYYESEPGRRSAAKLLTKDEARRIAANIAKLAPIRGRMRRGPTHAQQ